MSNYAVHENPPLLYSSFCYSFNLIIPMFETFRVLNHLRDSYRHLIVTRFDRLKRKKKENYYLFVFRFYYA